MNFHGNSTVITVEFAGAIFSTHYVTEGCDPCDYEYQIEQKLYELRKEFSCADITVSQERA